jgi:hypothetical protein
MLILEIALGIVLAVVILAFWPTILGLGLILLALALVLIVAGLIIAWAVTGFASFGAFVAIVGGLFLLMYASRLTNREPERRRALGYGDSEASNSNQTTNNEEGRRHALGYDDSADEAGKR